MTQTIWKFEFDITDSTLLTMPQNSKILTVQVQHGKSCIWALVDPRQLDIKRRINVAGTGHDLSDCIMGKYIGSVQFHNGDLVFHVFDGGEM